MVLLNPNVHLVIPKNVILCDCSSQTISSLGKLLFYLLAIVLLLPSLEKLILCKCRMAAAQ